MVRKKVNQHYLFSVLKRMYLTGKMIKPETKGMWMIFHKDAEAQALGTKGLTFITFEDFVDLVKLK